MQSQLIIGVMAVLQVIHLLAYLGAASYAVAKRKRHPTASRYLLLAIVISGVSRGLSFVAPMLLRTTSLSWIYSLTVVKSIFDIMAFCLIVVAVFIRRTPEEENKADDVVTPNVPPRPSGNPYESPR